MRAGVGGPQCAAPRMLSVLRAAQRLDPKELQVDSGRKVSPGCAAPPRTPSQGCTKIPALEKKECILHHLFEGAEFHPPSKEPNLDPLQRRWVGSLAPFLSLPASDISQSDVGNTEREDSFDIQFKY